MDYRDRIFLAIALAQWGHRGDAPEPPDRPSSGGSGRRNGSSISRPVTLRPDQTVKAQALFGQTSLPGFRSGGGRLVGILTNRDLRFARRTRPSEIMTEHW